MATRRKGGKRERVGERHVYPRRVEWSYDEWKELHGVLVLFERACKELGEAYKARGGFRREVARLERIAAFAAGERGRWEGKARVWWPNEDTGA